MSPAGIILSMILWTVLVLMGAFIDEERGTDCWCWTAIIGGVVPSGILAAWI